MKKTISLLLALFTTSLFFACTDEEIGPKGVSFTVNGNLIHYPVVEGFMNQSNTYSIKAHHGDTSRGFFIIAIPELKAGKYTQDEATMLYIDDDKNMFANFNKDNTFTVDISTIDFAGNNITGAKGTFTGNLNMFALNDTSIVLSEGSINF